MAPIKSACSGSTAVSTGGPALLSRPVESGMPVIPNDLVVTNSIARGKGVDIQATSSNDNPDCLNDEVIRCAIGLIHIDHSDFGTRAPLVTAPDAGVISEGAGNIAGDPLFADAANGDFHLRAGSPAIDAGAALDLALPTDLDGSARVQGGAPDLGALESAAPAGPPTVAGAGAGAGARRWRHRRCRGGRNGAGAGPNGARARAGAGLAGSLPCGRRHARRHGPWSRASRHDADDHAQRGSGGLHRRPAGGDRPSPRRGVRGADQCAGTRRPLHAVDRGWLGPRPAGGGGRERHVRVQRARRRASAGPGPVPLRGQRHRCREQPLGHARRRLHHRSVVRGMSAGERRVGVMTPPA